MYENADPRFEAPFFTVQKDARIINYDDFYRNIKYPDKEVTKNLPSDSDAVMKAKNFLTVTHLMPPDAIIDGTRHIVTEQLTTPTKKEIVGDHIIVLFHREMNNIIVQNSKITLDIGANSDVIGMSMNWRDYSPYKESATKSIDTAFSEFTKKRLQSSLTLEPDKIVVNDVSLLYYSHPAAETENYLQPVYVFKGYVQIGDETSSFDPVYIPATVEQFDTVPGCSLGACQ